MEPSKKGRCKQKLRKRLTQTDWCFFDQVRLSLQPKEGTRCMQPLNCSIGKHCFVYCFVSAVGTLHVCHRRMGTSLKSKDKKHLIDHGMTCGSLPRRGSRYENRRCVFVLFCFVFCSQMQTRERFVLYSSAACTGFLAETAPKVDSV